MKLSVYTSQSALIHVVVPHHLLPSAEAEQFYGPLRLLSTHTLGPDADQLVWRRAALEIESRHYAVISTAQTCALFGVQFALPNPVCPA